MLIGSGFVEIIVWPQADVFPGKDAAALFEITTPIQPIAGVDCSVCRQEVKLVGSFPI
jgi:hypothetical protein